MKNSFFRYDYKCRVTYINLLLGVICLIIAITTYKIKLLFIIMLCVFAILMLNSFFIYNHGIHINYTNKKIYILDDLLLRTLKFENVKYISYKIIDKEKKSSFKGVFTEYFNPHTYMTNCEYIYNEGMVLNFEFHLKDGTILESYFGWMYKEKNKNNINKQLDKIINIIQEYKSRNKF